LSVKRDHSKSRRHFLRTAAVAGGGLLVIPRHVLGRGFVAPSDRLVIAAIGVGGKGQDDLKKFDAAGNVGIAALCDVDDRQAVASVDRFPKARYYKDFRKMLDKEHKHIDAVSVSTPDNTHAVAAIAAMQMGKHVYVQKPLTHDIFEARMLTQAAAKYRVVTQMGNQGASGDGVRLMQEWYAAGLIGDAISVHVWTNRPVWPQGSGRPKSASEIPKELDWDLWLGPADFEDYHEEYVPFSWRGYWAFGTGSLGDMGCHLIDPAFKVLGLGFPSEVECSVANVYEKMWSPAYHPESCPIASSITFRFPGAPGKPNISLYWMDGGLTPERPVELGSDEPMGDRSGGGIIVGNQGKIMYGTYGEKPTLLPASRTKDTQLPQTLARVPEGHYAQWVNACIAGFGRKPVSSPFEYAGPLTETILIGNLALRSWNIKQDKAGKDEPDGFPGRKGLLWDATSMRMTNFEPANQLVKRQYRAGWT